MSEPINYTTTWNVNLLHCYPQEQQYTDVVFRVDWTCTVSAPYVSGSQSGSLATASEPHVTPVTYTTGSPFIPFNQLTNDIVMGWVFPIIGNQKYDIQARLESQVENMIYPNQVALPPPWAPAPTPSGSIAP